MDVCGSDDNGSSYSKRGKWIRNRWQLALLLKQMEFIAENISKFIKLYLVFNIDELLFYSFEDESQIFPSPPNKR